MAGNKRPYPDAWGSNYYSQDRPNLYGGSYYSGMQWGQGYSGPPSSGYPPPAGNYYPSPAPVTREYYSSPAPPQRDPPPPGDWDYTPPVKKDYNPSPSGDMSGQYTPTQGMRQQKPQEGMDFTDDYSAFYGDNTSYNNRGRRGGPSRGRGRGWGFAGRGGSNQYNNQEHSSNCGGYQGRRDYQGQGRGGDRGRAGFRGRGSPRGGDTRGGRGGKRGLPPGQIAGRGKGKGNSQSVPPVHSLAKEKTTFLDVAKMSVPEKLHRFCLYLRDGKHNQGNAIQTINNGLSASKLGMNLEFDYTGIAWVSNSKLFTGTITLDGVFISRSVGLSKKEMKLSTFEKALDVFMTHTVAEIYNLKDPGPQHVTDEIIADRKTKEKAPGKASDLEKELAMCPLEKLIHDIKARPESETIIHTVEHACARQSFSTSFKFEIEPASNLFFIGKFTFDGVVIARGHAPNKKQCKKNTLASAYERLTSLPLEELQKDVPELTIKASYFLERCKKKALCGNGLTKHLAQIIKGKDTLSQMMDQDGRGFPVEKNIRKEPLENRFAQFVSLIKLTTLVNGLSHAVDTSAMNCGLYPTLVYKTTEPDNKETNVKCELYIERIYIAGGEASKKKESTTDTYMKAYNVLKNTTVETLLNEHRRLTDEYIHSPQSGDMVFKGTGKALQSNIEMLKKAGFDPNNLTSKVEDMIVVENHGWPKDRVKSAFCILKYACANNGLFLQWETEAVMNHNIFKCLIFIDGKEVGYSYGFGRNHSKVLACLDVLYNLYEKHDILVLHNFHVVEDCIKYEDLKEEAKKLKESGVDPVAPIFDGEDYDLPDQYFSTLMQMKLDEYVANHNEEEYSQLVFGPGFTAPEWQDLKNRTKKMKMKYYCQRHEEKECFIIEKSMSFHNVVKFLKQKAEKRVGKFELVMDDEKPKYADVATYILKEFPDNPSALKSSKELQLTLKNRTKKSKREERRQEANKTGDEMESDDVDLALVRMAKEDTNKNPDMTGFDSGSSK